MNFQRIFWTFLMAFSLLTFSACCTLSTKFENLTTGTEYRIGDTFTDNGMEFALIEFHYNNSTYQDGFANVGSMNAANGTGNEIYVGNINVKFNLPKAYDHISFDVGWQGGWMNLEINGTWETFNDLTTINGSVIAGVTVTTSGGHNTPGKWEFDGRITSFAVGGQEFGFDNICVK